MQLLIERLLAGQEEMKTKIKADVKAWHERTERVDAEGRHAWRRNWPNGKPTEE
jgi:hypothetical protein